MVTVESVGRPNNSVKFWAELLLKANVKRRTEIKIDFMLMSLRDYNVSLVANSLEDHHNKQAGIFSIMSKIPAFAGMTVT
jgi:hypothetical protein